VHGQPDHVIALLTDPDAATIWSPVDFDVAELEGERLEPGTRAVLSGRLAGRPVKFDLEVYEAGDGRLSLCAIGPVTMDVDYELVERDDEALEVVAQVRVHDGRGLIGRLLASAADGLLAAGTLQNAVNAIAREAEADAAFALAA
jgi:hypothetical protein